MCRINRDDPDKWDAPYLNLKCYGKGSEYLCQCDYFFLFIVSIVVGQTVVEIYAVQVVFHLICMCLCVWFISEFAELIYIILHYCWIVCHCSCPHS